MVFLPLIRLIVLIRHQHAPDPRTIGDRCVNGGRSHLPLMMVAIACL
jgi:hypothetical protein